MLETLIWWQRRNLEVNDYRNQKRIQNLVKNRILKMILSITLLVEMTFMRSLHHSGTYYYYIIVHINSKRLNLDNGLVISWTNMSSYLLIFCWENTQGHGSFVVTYIPVCPAPKSSPKKAILKFFAKTTGKHLTMLVGFSVGCNFIINRIQARVFFLLISWNFIELFFNEHQWTIVSENESHWLD